MSDLALFFDKITLMHVIGVIVMFACFAGVYFLFLEPVTGYLDRAHVRRVNRDISDIWLDHHRID